MLAALVLVLGSLFMSGSVQGKDIYRWTDGQGDTHYADKVPKKYKGAAQKIDLTINRLGTAEEGGGASASRSAPVSSYSRAPSMDRATVQSGAVVPSYSSGSGTQDGTDDCETLRRQYWESQACFNRYRNVNGSVKPEAFRICREIQSPAAQCEPLVTEP